MYCMYMWMYHMDTYMYTSTTVVGWGSVNAPPLGVLKGTNKELKLPNLLYLAGCTNRTRQRKTECHLIGVLLTPCKGVHEYRHICGVVYGSVACSTAVMQATYDRQLLLRSSLGCQSFSSSLERTGLIPSPTYIHTYIHTYMKWTL